MDQIDRTLLGLLQKDADQTYAQLGKVVHLSAPAVHERVRKLRASGVIQRTTIEIEPAAVDKEMLVYALVDAHMWCGDETTTEAFRAIEDIEAAYAVAGKACVMVKIRVRGPNELQHVLRQIYNLEETRGTESIVVLDTLFERPMNIS